MPRFETLRKRAIPEATRGPWRSQPVARLDSKGQLYFSHLAAQVFGGRRLVILGFDQGSRTLQFTAVETVPEGMVEDDLFRLTWGNGRKNGCGVAVKSLLRHVGFQANRAAQELEIAEMNHDQHTISIVLPPDQMPADDSVGDFDAETWVADEPLHPRAR